MKDFIDQYWENDALPALMEFGTIPNVSPAYRPHWSEEGHMDRAASFLKQWAESRNIAGLTVELLRENMRTPFLFIEVPGSKDETILLYGHFDKQPPMLPWRDGLDPWVPKREGDLLYGRGLADDGYAFFAALGAVEAAQNSGAPTPRVVILIEGSEESGSVDLDTYLNHLKEKIGEPDIVITLDSEGPDSEHLWLTRSLRGNVEGYLTIETTGRSLHSGHASGVVPSVTRILRILLDRIEDVETGTIKSPLLNPVPNDEKKKFCKEVSESLPRYVEEYNLPPSLKTVAPTTQEVIEQNLMHAALEVTGITGLPLAAEAGTVSAGRLTVRVSVRIPPDVDPAAADQYVKSLFEQDPPYNASVSYDPVKHSAGWFAPPYPADLQSKINSVAQEVYDTQPAYRGGGGSIPFIHQMISFFPNARHIVTGILGASSEAHGPNENMSISRVKRITESVAHLLTAV